MRTMNYVPTGFRINFSLSSNTPFFFFSFSLPVSYIFIVLSKHATSLGQSYKCLRICLVVFMCTFLTLIMSTSLKSSLMFSFWCDLKNLCARPQSEDQNPTHCMQSHTKANIKLLIKKKKTKLGKKRADNLLALGIADSICACRNSCLC